MSSFDLIEKLEKEHSLSLNEYEQLIREYTTELADFAAKKSNLSVFTENAEYVDLAENPMFSELFIKNMMFTFYI